MKKVESIELTEQQYRVLAALAVSRNRLPLVELAGLSDMAKNTARKELEWLAEHNFIRITRGVTRQGNEYTVVERVVVTGGKKIVLRKFGDNAPTKLTERARILVDDELGGQSAYRRHRPRIKGKKPQDR
jgi:hypothetical protein